MALSIPSSLTAPWPWYVAGPLIGLFVPVLLLVGNKLFGLSANFRHLCAIAAPGRISFFRYDWRQAGSWNLIFAGGLVVGGVVAHYILADPASVQLSPATYTSLAALGVHDTTGLVPNELFSWDALTTWRGMLLIVGGGFLVGFGTAYAGGCTSGHAISGLADFQLPSLIAVFGFFVGGLLATWIILPFLFHG